MTPLQPRAGASVPEQQGAGGAHAPEAAGHISALVGTRVRRLLAFVDIETRKPHPLGPVPSGTHAAITSDGVLTNLSVAAHVAPILALVDVHAGSILCLGHPSRATVKALVASVCVAALLVGGADVPQALVDVDAALT